MYIKVGIANQKEIIDTNKYREVKIIIPRSSEELEKDFQYLRLEDEELSMKNAYIKECEFIDKQDPTFSTNITNLVKNVISKAQQNGNEICFQDIKELYGAMKNLDNFSRDKLLAIIESKSDYISSINGIVKYAHNLPAFELVKNISSSKEYVKNLIRNNEITLDDVIDYIDLEVLGDDYMREEEAVITKYGLIKQVNPCTNEYIREEEEEELE